MRHQHIVSDAIASYQQTVNEAIASARTLALAPLFSLDFNTARIEPAWIGAVLAGLRTGYKLADKRKCAIYVFSLADSSASAAAGAALLAHKQSRRTDKTKDNLCTVNAAFGDSATLYVGRSFTPRSRIAQHLGASDGGTYAMHLQQWALPLALSIRLDVYDVPAYRDSVGLERGMNVLETGIWDHLRPMFGRRGDK